MDRELHTVVETNANHDQVWHGLTDFNAWRNWSVAEFTRSQEDTRKMLMRGFMLMLCCLSSLFAHAGDPEAGKQKSVACVACHGADGISVYSAWPNLVGQDAQYIASQLKAFRAGTRKSAMMYPMAFDLSDKDIDDIAAYYNQSDCK